MWNILRGKMTNNREAALEALDKAIDKAEFVKKRYDAFRYPKKDAYEGQLFADFFNSINALRTHLADAKTALRNFTPNEIAIWHLENSRPYDALDVLKKADTDMPKYEQRSIAAKDLTDEQLQAINGAKHPVDAYKAKLREQIEGMKDEASDSNYAGFYNQALSDVLKLLEDDNE